MELNKYHLGIEWEVLEKVGAVELLAVGLHHRDPVLSPLEYLHLVHGEDVGPSEVSLSCDENLAISILQSYGFVVISILDLLIKETSLFTKGLKIPRI